MAVNKKKPSISPRRLLNLRSATTLNEITVPDALRHQEISLSPGGLSLRKSSSKIYQPFLPPTVMSSLLRAAAATSSSSRSRPTLASPPSSTPSGEIHACGSEQRHHSLLKEAFL